MTEGAPLPAIRGVVTLDSAERARICYLLPAPLTEGLMALVAGSHEVTTQRFSHPTEGTIDCVSFGDGEHIHAKAALYGNQLTVTYHKTEGYDQVREGVQQALSRGFGTRLVMLRAKES